MAKDIEDNMEKILQSVEDLINYISEYQELHPPQVGPGCSALCCIFFWVLSLPLLPKEEGCLSTELFLGSMVTSLIIGCLCGCIPGVFFDCANTKPQAVAKRIKNEINKLDNNHRSPLVDKLGQKLEAITALSPTTTEWSTFKTELKTIVGEFDRNHSLPETNDLIPLEMYCLTPH